MASFRIQFRPRLLDAMRGYNGEQFSKDLSAGLTVGIVALPLAMAFAIASGVKPEAGIYTAIIAGLLISVLGGSRVQIGGPAGAFIVIIYGIIAKYGLANLLISTIMAGLLLFAMGALRLGNLIRFIPIAVVIGFTNGIAVLIALSQVKDALGLRVESMPADFFSALKVIGQNLHSADWRPMLICGAGMLLIALWPKSYQPNATRWRRMMAQVPGTIVVLVLATLAVSATGLGVETIGTKFGGIPQGLPSFALPEFSWDLAKQLVAPTLTIALLGAIESLLCARVADSMTEDRHDPNQELMAQGIANFITPFFGGIPATGTIARTVTNVRSGARTPVSGVIHALTLLAIILVAAPLAEDIPLAALSAILLMVAWNMGEWREFARLRQFNPTYRTIMLSTFLLTVIFDLTVAVEVGLLLASLFFIYRISSITRIDAITDSGELGGPAPGVQAYRLFGSLFFGAVSKLEALLDPARPQPRVMVLEMHQLINLDTTGLDALHALQKALAKNGNRLVLAGCTAQPLSLIRRSGFLDLLGEENVQPDLGAAMQRARVLAGGDTPAATDVENVANAASVPPSPGTPR
jgi:SulP family sulfate permease